MGSSHLWETEILQYCIVVVFKDASIARENLLDTLLSEVFVHNLHLHIGCVDFEADKEDLDMGKTKWLSDTDLRVWITEIDIKKHIQEVLG